MFNKPQAESAPKPRIAEMAGVQSGTFWQIIVSKSGYSVFREGEEVKRENLESLTIDIDAGNENTEASVTAVASTVDSGVPRALGLFPGSVEIFGFGRLLVLTGADSNSLDGLWFSVGLDETGLTNRLRGLQCFQFAIAPGIVSGSIAWEDGNKEDLFPELTAGA